MTHEARLFKGLNRSSTLRLVPGWWDQEKATVRQRTGQRGVATVRVRTTFNVVTKVILQNTISSQKI